MRDKTIFNNCLPHKIVGANLIRNGGQMAFAQNSAKELSAVALRSNDRMKLAMIGIGVIFASLGLGEAVYRFAFLDFDGATDRLPIEMLFGLSFAWMTMKLAGRFYQHHMKTSERIKFIRDRNYKIRHAVDAIKLVPYPTDHQAIRVIREEVDRIEWALTEIAPG
jgi:hypothetical protein